MQYLAVHAQTISTNPVDQLDQAPFTNVMFTVAVSGNIGTPLYFWLFNGQGVSNGAKYSGVTTDTLTVMSVAEGDVGIYDCTVFVDGVPLFSEEAELTLSCKISISIFSITNNIVLF